MAQMCVDPTMQHDGTSLISGSSASNENWSWPQEVAGESPSTTNNSPPTSTETSVGNPGSSLSSDNALPPGVPTTPTPPDPGPTDPGPTDPGSPDPDPTDPPPTDPGETTPPPIITPPPSVPNTQLKPIARWSTVPYQRINPGETINVGVVAFSKYGIAGVRFTISGQGYTGPSPVDVTQMSWNNQTGLYEYWTPIAAGNFTGNGSFTVEAEVYGNDGGFRNKNTDGGGVGLDSLPLTVNATGAMPHVRAWVSTSGNDSTGVVNTSSKPYASIGRAIDAIRAYRSSQGMGNNADGGVVHLMPGSYSCSTGGVSTAIACSSEWLTITTADGGTYNNTTLLPGSIAPTRKIRLRGLTLKGGGVIGMSSADVTQAMVWADGCALIGSGRGITGSHPLSCEYARTYYTDSSITEVQQATTGAAMCRGLSIVRISDDSFQNVPLVLNCLVDDIDPLSTGAHADAWQHAMGNNINKRDDNVIVYNLIATRLKYQSIFIRGDIDSPPSMAQGMAFVNVYMEMLSNSTGWGGWGRWADHLLWWHCTFAVKGMGFMNDTYAGVKYPCKINNFSVKGCNFEFLTDVGSTIDWSSFESNHYTDAGFTPGSDITTGNDGTGTNGAPASGSPLLDRMTPIVPADANNRLRQPLADIGALQG